MFRIGEFSRFTRIPVSALRYYDQVGLLRPAAVDDATGYRSYRAAQLPQANRILALKDLGLSLEEIGPVLADELSSDELRGMLRLKQAEARARLADDQARLRRVEIRLGMIEKEGIMPTQEVLIRSVEPIDGLSVRAVIPTPMAVGELLGDAMAGIAAAGLESTGPPAAVYHDAEFVPEDLDVEVVLPVADARSVTALTTPAGRKLAPRTLEGGASAVTVFVGAYERLAEPYQALATWIADHGQRVDGPARELYMSGPDDAGEPVTEIRIPVASD